MMSGSSDPDDAFILERRFAFPPSLVWRAWSEPDLLKRWYKPMPTCETSILSFDFRVGGRMLYEMRFGAGAAHTEMWEYLEISKPCRLQWKQAMSDEDGNIVRSPQMPSWPRMLLTTIELTPDAQGTLQRMVWQPYEASEEEVQFFLSSAADMGGRGWASAFDNLKEELEQMASGALET